MSQAAAQIPRAPGRLPPVGLVAGRESLRNLGPVVQHMIVGLLDEPRPITLVCPEREDLGSLPVPPVRVLRYRLPRLPPFRKRVLKALAEEAVKSGLALLHALDYDALALARQLSSRTGLPHVVGIYSLHGDVRAGDRLCRALLVASEPIGRALLEAAAAPPELVRLFRPGVYPARMATCFTDPQHAVAIVAGGELRHYGPWSAVVESFANIRRQRQDCAFFIVGNGRAEGPLRRLAQKLGLMLDLTFVDRQSPEGLTDILRAADIFIAPDPSQRVDVELLAAMASGTPVVTAGSVVDDFISEQTALIFPRGRAGELTARISALLDDRAAARSLAERALAYLRQNHSPARMVRQLGELYDAIAAGKPPAP